MAGSYERIVDILIRDKSEERRQEGVAGNERLEHGVTELAEDIRRSAEDESARTSASVWVVETAPGRTHPALSKPTVHWDPAAGLPPVMAVPM